MKKNLFVSLIVLFMLTCFLCVCSGKSELPTGISTPLDIRGTSFSNLSSNTVDYSTNSKSTVKNGNSGVYAYKSRGGSYSIYWIIDFDSRYVYYFIDGNGDKTCDKVKMVSGDLNSVLIITYHDGGSTWSYGLHFKYKNQPDHLIVQDNRGNEYDFYTTNLKSALSLRNKKTIINY